MFLDFLDRLREQPESYRRRVTFITAAVVTLIIAFIWIATFDFTSSRGAQQTTTEQRNADVKSPFGTIRDSVTQAFVDGTRRVDEVRDFFQDSPTSEQPAPEAGSSAASTSKE